MRGAAEIGMLAALLERGIRPDLVVGTSVGAVNGAAVASNPTPATLDRLIEAWTSPEAARIYGDGVLHQARRAFQSHTHINSPEPLRGLLEQFIGPDTRFEELDVPFAAVSACIERAAEHVFTTGPVIPAVIASTAVPGLFPAAEIGGEHFVDGGVVNSIPISPAVDAGAREIYVLQVGVVEQPLTAPHTPIETARVAFEISRRHRFARDLETCHDGVRIHVLPSGGPLAEDGKLSTNWNISKTLPRIEHTKRAAAEYLDTL